jgi:signal transduction histidine kinase
LQIVHDLKNQLNGLKLYATFLRKRLEGEDHSTEERETLAKLIAGLDRAASDLTALVRYARPLELRRQPRTDLQRIVDGVVRDVESRRATSASTGELSSKIEGGGFYGELDSGALSEAFRAITERAMGRTRPQETNSLSLNLSRTSGPPSPSALIEWRGAKLDDRAHPSLDRNRSVHEELATKIIEAHGGSVEYDTNTIRVRLPLSD